MLLDTPLLDELVAAYKYSICEQWQQETDHDKREQLFAKVYVANDLSHWIDNKCRELINGSADK